MHPVHFPRQQQRGFTLIELMIVVAIVAILAAIAYPSYQNYVLKTHRADALTALSQNQVILERCYAQNFSYSAACATTTATTSPQGYYSLVLSNQAATTYTLTATPSGTQTKDTTCASFSIDQANNQLAVDNKGNSQNTVCWQP